MMNKDESGQQERTRKTLERLGHGLSTGDLREVSGCWDVPSLVLSDQGAVPVGSKDEIEKFLRQAVMSYRSQGLTSTKPELERFEILSETLVAADVRWPTFDKDGVEKSSERSHYILQIGSDGQPRIRVALTRTK
jgi:hypothetical protein